MSAPGEETSAAEAEATATSATTGEAEEDDRLLVLPPLQPCSPAAERLTGVRVMSWNVSAGRVGSLEEIRDVLLEHRPDVVVLQELDVLVRRTGSVDQPRVLADALGYSYAFAASLEFDGGDFGMAVLSWLPFADVRRISLPSESGYEPRIALDTTLCAGPLPLRVVDVHADFVPSANAAGLVALGEEVGSTLEAPTIIAGDFNAPLTAEGGQALMELTGAVDALLPWDPGPTHGDGRIDHALVSPAPALVVTGATTIENDASDHRALWVEVQPR
ncbi:endonuclease/exonuclease/phosphatase family protein [Paraliomyxa miuraensis]|uniref:endonuclease/exonuclease/phosphatase family protein n=1 Tax=Paraliomyxa miuraensis TaxID=376150 RepID=UPI00225737CE|nr:endonuclease/exonuclease/phosphatase family protein [Paraliomyxa miuraensis]MCX4241733.1 endonuclease/exonuclease/phosphatase family protein [Paraliomyxa miuraensis]